MVVPRFVQQALRGDPLTVYGDGGQTRCFCDVRDTVRAIIGLAECPDAVGQVFNIGDTNEISINQLAHQVIRTVPAIDGKTASPDDSIVFVTYEEAYHTDFEDMRRRVPDTHKIKRYIDWEPRLNLEQTLRDIAAEFIASNTVLD